LDAQLEVEYPVAIIVKLYEPPLIPVLVVTSAALKVAVPPLRGTQPSPESSNAAPLGSPVAEVNSTKAAVVPVTVMGA
jgi:hypothetical protein